MTEYVVQRKRINSGGVTYWPGDVVPEAEGWKTLRSYLGAGILAPVEDDEVAAPSLEEGVAGLIGESGPEEVVLDEDAVVAGDEVDPPTDLDLMSKGELREYAEANGIEIPGRISKPDLLDLLTGP